MTYTSFSSRKYKQDFGPFFATCLCAYLSVPYTFAKKKIKSD